MRKIVIATDGSSSAREAVRYGLDLAGDSDAQVTFVHVMPAVDIIPGGGWGMPAALPHEESAVDRAPLDEALELAEEAGVDAKTMLLKGQAVDEIVAYADAVDADLIVLGSRGHGSVASALLGSVSRGVSHLSRRPVLIIRAAGEAVTAPARAGRVRVHS